jgi:AcrR family transcriptional regulator
MIVSDSISPPDHPASDNLSPVAAPRASRSQATRQRILNAGRELFCDRGPHAVTSHAIAAHAGFASGTFYLHFKDKLTLFRELAEEAATELETRLRSVALEKTDPFELVQSQAEALVGFAEDQRDLLRIVFHPGGETGEVGARILERLARGVSARRREAVAAGLAPDCFDSDVLAQATVGMWAHVLAWWAEDPSRASRDAIVRTLTHFQLHGNRAEAGAVCGILEPNLTLPEGDLSR